MGEVNRMGEHKILKSANGDVHYWIHRNRNKDARCIFFTHGLTANHEMYEKQITYFNEKYTTITWDVPLHGLSRPYRNFSYNNTAQEMKRILEEEGIETVILVGMSMGGYPSQMFGYLFPDMVECFIAIDTTPFGREYYSKSDLWWLRRVAPIAKVYTDKFLRKSMAKSVSTTQYSYDMMMHMLKPLTKDEIIEQMYIAYSVFADENRDMELSFPILILLGDHDRTGKVKQYCEMWAKKISAPFHIIKNAAHFSNGDNAEQVNREIEEFIK